MSNIFADIKRVAEASFAESVDVLEVRQTAMSDEFVVLSRFRNRPAERAYFTHKFSTTGNCFYYGHYDMSIQAAAKSLEERA
jgi:hypothetical protein